MIRLVLSDTQWEWVAPLSAADHRLFLEAVLWMARVGAPCRDLPETFGNWNSVFQRFRRWAQKGVFEELAISNNTEGSQPDTTKQIRASKP